MGASERPEGASALVRVPAERGEAARTVGLARVDEAPRSAARVVHLRNAAEAYPAWLEAIARAQREILLEMYWFDSDATGRRFAAALCERARAGVEVFVLYDAVGSLGADPAMWAELERAGAKVLEYHPIAPWRRRFRLAAVTRRDHRKILVCDGRVGFTGGINICDPAAPKEQGGGGWRDDAVRVEGPPVRELRALFFDTWCKIGGPPPRAEPDVTARARRALVAAATEQLARGPAEENAPALAVSKAAGADVSVIEQEPSAHLITVLGHASTGADRRVRDHYVRHIREARSRILIANAYFIPDHAVRRALERAARRGVEVRVLVPRHSDVPSVAWAGRATFARLMRAGVHIHQWIDGMMHAKTAVIDQWATVGSYNLDYRSLRFNLEVTVASHEPSFVESLERAFRDDLTRCEEVDPRAWARRPLIERLIERFYWFVRTIL